MADRPKYGANTDRPIFQRHAPTAEPAAPAAETAQTEPTGGKRQTVSTGSKTTVVLREDQIAALDDLTMQLRRQHQLVVPRTELLRVIVDALIDSRAHIDLADAGSLDEMRAMLTERLKR